MDFKKGKYTIICKHLNGKTELYDTDEYWLVDNDNSIRFLDLNNVKLDPISKKQLATTLPRLICKIEGGDSK